MCAASRLLFRTCPDRSQENYSNVQHQLFNDNSLLQNSRLFLFRRIPAVIFVSKLEILNICLGGFQPAVQWMFIVVTRASMRVRKCCKKV